MPGVSSANNVCGSFRSFLHITSTCSSGSPALSVTYTAYSVVVLVDLALVPSPVAVHVLLGVVDFVKALPLPLLHHLFVAGHLAGFGEVEQNCRSSRPHLRTPSCSKAGQE